MKKTKAVWEANIIAIEWPGMSLNKQCSGLSVYLYFMPGFHLAMLLVHN